MHPLGTITQAADGTAQICYERLLSHPIDKVWQAIADPEKVALWLGNMTLELRLGGHFELHFPDTEEYHMTGSVTQLDPPHRLAYIWHATGMNPNEIIWELHEEGPATTRLFFSFTKVDSHAMGAAAGWHTSLDRMEEVIAGTRTVWIDFDQDRLKVLEAQYRSASEVESEEGRACKEMYPERP